MEATTANAMVTGDRTGRMVQLEQLSSLGLPTSSVAHEVNNVLAGTKACVEALRREAVRGPERDKYFETILEGLERIEGIVRSVLDYSRPHEASTAVTDVADVLDACLRLAAPAIRLKDAVVESSVAPGDVTLRVDRTHLTQALLNVLTNAAYAAPRGGTIGVTWARAEGRLGISVSDDGPGMPSDVMARAGEPFFTTKPPGEGTGLGLAVTTNILHRYGGHVQIRSLAEGGTVVTLWFPGRMERIGPPRGEDLASGARR